nr:G497 [uncultured bacterium]
MWPLVLVVVAVAVTQIAVATPATTATADPLERTALRGPAAQRALLTAAAWAGDRAVAVGERGVVLHSDDMGVTWEQAAVPVSVTLTAVAFATPRTGWTVGHSGAVLRSDDAGDSWTLVLDGRRAAQLVLTQTENDPGADEERLQGARQLVNDGPDKPFLGILPLGADSAVVYGAYNLVFLTRDGGKSWASLGHRVDNVAGLHVYGLVQTPSGGYAAAGEQGTLYAGAGPEFALTAVPAVGDASLFGLLSTASGELYAYGLLGTVLRSSDDGHSWTACVSGTRASITDAAERADGSLALITAAGEVRLSAAGACRFRSIPAGEPAPFTAVLALPDGHLLVTGPGGARVVSVPPSAEVQ